MYDLIRLTVSVNQSDTLEASIRCNRPFINSSIILTSSTDDLTMDVCRRNNVTCRITNTFYRRGAIFNKGAAYKEVQHLLHKDASMKGKHLLFLDADICLPTKLWANVIDNLPTTPNSLLSVLDRCVLRDPADLSKRRYSIETQPKGYVTTLGFFQLYKINTSSPLYPDNFPTAAVSDKVFGNKFQRSRRAWLPGRAFHMGTTRQWHGRHDAPQNWVSIAEDIANAEC
jgi:hypothetical protein